MRLWSFPPSPSLSPPLSFIRTHDTSKLTPNPNQNTPNHNSYATAVETGAPTWSALGAALFVGSSLSEAARVVGTQRLMTTHHFSSLETLVYVSFPSAFLLIGASLLTEGTAPLVMAASSPATQLILDRIKPQLVYAAALSFLVNLTSVWAILSTGSLTFKVAGCLKNLAVIWYSVAVSREHVSSAQIAGYLVSVAGFMLYTLAKAREEPAAAGGAKGGKAKSKAA